jgi:8-oxo-dGTP diphosphatase
MNSVAKLIIIDEKNKYLLLYRSNHPTFKTDPDLPGGTLERGEIPRDTMIREVEEEIGIKINSSSVREIYSGIDYSRHGTHYSLFLTTVKERPNILLSWEHSSYDWLEKDSFVLKASTAIDTYMHMVASTIANSHV